VKLFLRERESAALVRAIADRMVVTSALAGVEIARAIRVAGAVDDVETDVNELLEGCAIVEADSDVLRLAAALADPGLRTLDAVHLASALRAGVRRFFVYDRQLSRAARAAGLHVEAPGLTRVAGQ
jgi:predicted nucleic acid-binding protein